MRKAPGLPESWPTEARELLRQAQAKLTDELAIAWDGRVYEWRSDRGAGPIQTMSVTKSVVGLAIGRLVTLGKLKSIDEPVHTLFPEWQQGRKASITVRMLIEHTSGLQNVPMTTAEIQPSPDYVQLALAAELESEPGSTYSYNNKAVNLLAGIVERADGRKLDDFTHEELFQPLGVDDFEWLRDATGNPHAMSGLALHAKDLVRIGQLVLQAGHWAGGQLIASDWFEQMDNPGDHERESALMWWHVHDAKLTVTEQHIQALRTADCDPEVVGFFEQNIGEYASPMDFLVAARKALGIWQERLPAGVMPFEMQFGRKLAYRAEGDLGQYVYAFRDSGLTVVRLIRESTIEAAVPDFQKPPASIEEHLQRLEPVLFADFENLVKMLATAP